MTPTELRQLLFLYTQPNPSKEVFKQSAKVLVRMGYIVENTSVPGISYALTEEGRKFVESLCEFVAPANVNPPLTGNRTFWTLTNNTYVIDESELRMEGVDPFGRRFNWKTDLIDGTSILNSDMEITHWVGKILSPTGEVVKLEICND